jgi:hypothetical protein
MRLSAHQLTEISRRLSGVNYGDRQPPLLLRDRSFFCCGGHRLRILKSGPGQNFVRPGPEHPSRAHTDHSETRYISVGINRVVLSGESWEPPPGTSHERAIKWSTSIGTSIAFRPNKGAADCSACFRTAALVLPEGRSYLINGLPQSDSLRRPDRSTLGDPSWAIRRCDRFDSCVVHQIREHELRLVAGVEVLQTRVCRSEEEVLNTHEQWQRAMLAAG